MNARVLAVIGVHMNHFSRGRAVNQSRRRFVQTLSLGGGAAALGLSVYPLRKAGRNHMVIALP